MKYDHEVEYTPLIDLQTIDRHNWIDYEFAIIQNALHRMYCTGDKSYFDNSKIYNSHYNIVLFKLRKKEDSPEVAEELAVAMISKTMTNLLTKGIRVHPLAYKSYINKSIKYCLIDHIRKKKTSLPLELIAEPYKSNIAEYEAMESGTVISYDNSLGFSPEDTLSVKDLERQILFIIDSIMSKILVSGGKTLNYLIYHYYLNRNKCIYSWLSNRQVQVIQLVTDVLESIYPIEKYYRTKGRKDEFDE